jgi:hypothetical protein
VSHTVNVERVAKVWRDCFLNQILRRVWSLFYSHADPSRNSVDVGVDWQDSPSERVHEDAFRDLLRDPWQRDQERFGLSVRHGSYGVERRRVEVLGEEGNDVDDLTSLEASQARWTQ